MTTASGIASHRSASAHGLPTVGVEEEFLLVDAVSFRPRACNRRVADVAAELGLALQLELTECQVETNTPVCHTAVELRAHLLGMRSTLATAARAEGCRPVAVGAPVIGPGRLPVTADERYLRMRGEYGVLTTEQGVCGCHVHVDVPDHETAVGVCNHLRGWLPTLLALSANSALHRGTDSGYASWRSVLWSQWPAAGPPPVFRSADHYDALVDLLVDSGVLLDERMVYWDIRPSCHLPTVEIRVPDVQPTVDDALLLALLIRALVTTAVRAVGRGDPAPDADLTVVRAATALAARDGIDGRAIDPRVGRPSTGRAMLAALLAHVRDALEQAGDRPMVDLLLRRRIATGNGAQWQRRALKECGDPAAVVALAADRTVRGDASPSHGPADAGPSGAPDEPFPCGSGGRHP